MTKQVLKACRQKNYRVSVSNPCFEVWLLLHYTEIDDRAILRMLGKQPTDALTETDREALSCSHCVSELKSQAGGYNKRRVSELTFSAVQVRQAATRAAQMDSVAGDCPSLPGTRVYEIVETLVKRDALNLNLG